MKFRLILAFLLIFSIIVSGQENYSVAEIPSPLLENTAAIYRDYDLIFTVYSISMAIKKVHLAITVLNKSGDVFADLNVFYNSFIRISEIDGKIYNKEGELILKLKNADFEDFSAASGFSLYEENRVRHFTPNVNSYPFTVEYNYKVTYSSLINYPVWQPQYDYDLSVQHSTFQIIMPKNLNFRYKELNIPEQVKISYEKGTTIYQWSVSNLTVKEKEPYCPYLYEYTPLVITAPNEFKYGGYKGNMESWESYGQWTKDLLAGRDILPESTITEIKELTMDCKNRIEIIRRVYNYVQEKTRYVSIQLGIGGFQPIGADKVDEVKYGDCKALVNYTRALLNAAGINSYYTEVRAGNNEMDLMIDFPSNQTNHIILCVPNEKDTIWLECTSKTNPFGYTGNFTDDRHVLLITEDGGKIVKTNSYGLADNTRSRKMEMHIDGSGSAKASVKTTYSGLKFDDISVVINKSSEEQKKWYYNTLPLSNYIIKNIFYKVESNPVPRVHEELDLILNTYASVTGKRMFISLNPLGKLSSVPKTIDERKTEVVIRYPFQNADTIIFHIPDNFKIESIPENIQFSSTFGEYYMTTGQQENKIFYIRGLKMNKIISPASTYPELVDFLQKIYNADKIQAVLTRTL
ncbi:MAG: DUF3857 domain-containing protein [Bacteroidetes bacterium]|nr:DUF3857 domain-containing protein [Bacteroidota bacterium]